MNTLTEDFKKGKQTFVQSIKKLGLLHIYAECAIGRRYICLDIAEIKRSEGNGDLS